MGIAPFDYYNRLCHAAFSPRPLALQDSDFRGAGQQTFEEQIPKYCAASNRNVCATRFLGFSKLVYRWWKNRASFRAL